MKKNYTLAGLAFAFSMTAYSQFGSLDHSLDSGVGADSSIRAIALQADQKIIVAGDFQNFNEVSRKRVARLMADGSLDETFNTGAGANKAINSVLIQPDGKIIVAGDFAQFSGALKNHIVRLYSNGAIDTNFTIGNGTDGNISSAVLQADGKIMIAGDFTLFNWHGSKAIARLNADGTLDTSFASTLNLQSVSDIKIQADGKYIVNAFNKVLRLNQDGSLDTSFSSGSGANLPIKSVMIQSDGKIMVGGYFTTYNNAHINRLARLNTDGSLDETFDNGVGADYGVLAISEQPDGHILVSGIFSSVDDFATEKIARMNPDGSADHSFSSVSGADNTITTHFLQPDGRVIVAGDFTHFDGEVRNRLARINGYNLLSVKQHTLANKVKVYPNPVNSVLNIAFSEGETILSVQVTDLAGKVVLKDAGNFNSLNVASLSKGMYLLSVVSESGNFNTKFIKE